MLLLLRIGGSFSSRSGWLMEEYQEVVVLGQLMRPDAAASLRVRRLQLQVGLFLCGACQLTAVTPQLPICCC
jgi:hypothetical protein